MRMMPRCRSAPTLRLLCLLGVASVGNVAAAFGALPAFPGKLRALSPCGYQKYFDSSDAGAFYTTWSGQGVANHRCRPYSAVATPAPPSRSWTLTSTTALPMLLDRTVAVASISATAKLLSSIGLGAWAAVTPNVLDPTAVAALSRLTYWIFQPAFLLCSVSKTLFQASHSPDGLPTSALVLMPLTAGLQIGLGALVGVLLTSCVTMPNGEDEARDVRMCTAFANSGPLPLIFADALFGSASSLQTDVAACISFYLLLWSPLFWSFGRVILGTYGQNDAKNASVVGRIGQEARKVLSPPVIGSLLGVAVGGIPILQQLFFGVGPRQAPYLKPLYGALHTLGTAYLPAALLVLAGSLIKKRDNITTAVTTTTPVAGAEPVSTRSNSRNAPSLTAIVSIVVSRFVLAPLLSLGIWQGLAKLGWLGAAGSRARAVATFVLLMEGCMPPAQNSVIMLQLEGLSDRAASMAKLLTLLYGLAVVPVTILLSMCLALSGIMAQ